MSRCSIFLLSQIKIGVDGLDTRMTPLIFCKERMGGFFLFVCFVLSFLPQFRL